MPGFESHITTSSALGLSIGAIGYSQGMPLTSSVIAAGLCSLGGMLPDMDGDTGIPVRETFAMAAAAVTVMMTELFRTWGFDREMIVIAAGAVYLLTRFGVGGLFKAYTVHRGMWHSIPAAFSAGLVVFLICSYQDLAPRLFKSGAIVLGFLSHLVLDELHSFEVREGRLRVKSSLGTALKFWTTNGWWPNVSTYGKMAILLACSVYCFHCSCELGVPESTRIAKKEILPMSQERVANTAAEDDGQNGAPQD